MPINARTKGAVGEREAAAWLEQQGFTARRGQQFAGGPDSPDVVCDEFPFHLEVKRVENSSPMKWLGKATDDAGGVKPPLILWRPNRKPWVAVLWAKDLIPLVNGSLPWAYQVR